MIEQKKEYEILVHSSLPILREGLEFFFENSPFKVALSYQDLSRDLMHKIKPDLAAIILLADEADADFGLCHKIRLFSEGTPILIIMPEAPAAYFKYLNEMDDVHLLIEPFDGEKFNRVMDGILNL
jgi:two-component SAPR family response regulator